MTERMTLAQLREAQKPTKGVQRVIGARRVHVPGEGWFDSHREAARFQELRLLERGGEIRDLRRQVPIKLMGQGGPIETQTGKPMRYVADFTYVDARTDLPVIEDAKGHATDVFKIKKAILAAMGVQVREV
jgi:hypothetical protein